MHLRRLPLVVLVASLAAFTGRHVTVHGFSTGVTAVTAAPAISLSGSVNAQFFANPTDSLKFTLTPATPSAFTQNFSTLLFNPRPGMISCTNATGVNILTRPFTDVVPQADGSCSTIAAQGSGPQAGVGQLFSFFAVFEGAVTVSSPGQISLNLTNDDGFILGFGPAPGGAQPMRVSGENQSPPPATPFAAYSVVGAHNLNGGTGTYPVVIDFPAGGTYPFELDYTEAAGGALTMTVIPASSATPPPPPNGFDGSYLYGDGNPGVTAPCPCEVGDPVNVATGNLVESGPDLAVPGHGLGLLLTRTYNSLDAVSGGGGLFGAGWSSSYGQFLSADALGNVTVHQANGATVTFTPQGNAFTAPAFVTATLTTNVDGSLQFTLKDQRTARFADPSGNGPTKGKLLALSDRTGEQTTLSFDNAGRFVAVADSSGRQLLFTLDGNGRVTRVTDPLGRAVQYGYDAAGNLVAFVDVAGGITHYAYDSAHRVTGWTDPLGHSASTNYDALNRAVAQTDPLGQTMTFAYATDSVAGTVTTTVTDGNGHPTVQVYTHNLLTSLTRGAGTPQAATWTFGYDAALNRTSSTDPNGHTASATFDANGNMLTATDALSRTSHWTYTSRNDVATATDPLGVTSSLRYDAHGLLSSSSRPLVGSGQIATTTYTHTSAAHPGDLTSAVDPTGVTSSFTYDAAGNQTSSTDALGETTHTTHNAIGWPLTTTDPRGNSSSRQYDSFGDLVRSTDPLGDTSGAQFDADRNRISATDANGQTTRTIYDADNEPVRVIRADGTVLGTGYDHAGNVLSQTDGAGKVTSYAYDALDRLIITTDPLGRGARASYDSAGNRLTSTDPGGQVTSFSYDAANELVSVSYRDSATPAVHYAYDADGERTDMQDGIGLSSYVFDSLHRLTGQVDGLGQHVGYQYSLRGDLIGIVYPSGRQVSRGIDAVGRLTSVTDWLGHTSRFSYDAGSNLTGEQYANGIAVSIAYDAADRLTSIADTNSAGALLMQLGYSRDAMGQVTAVRGGESTSYSYTVLNQLAQESGRPDSYDAADNLTHRTTDSLSHDPANELLSLSRTGLSVAFNYDARGNRLSSTPSSGAPTSYGYDQANRLTHFSGPGGTASYSYSGDGLRQQKTVNGRMQPFAWNLAQGLPVLLSDGTNQYLYGPGGQVLEQVDNQGRASYLHQDQLGSTRLLSDVAGNVVARYGYDAYGRPAAFGRAPSPFGGPSTPFGYAGEYRDQESGLIYLRARYYDPDTGEFLSRDRLTMQTRQPYGYVRGNPLNATDPTGADEADFIASLDFSKPDTVWVGDQEYSVPADGQVPIGVIGGQEGNVSVRRANGSRWEPGYRGMPIYAGDNVKTDEKSVVAIDTVANGRMGIDRNSEIQVTATGEGIPVGSATNLRLVLKADAIWCKFQKDATSYRQRTQNALVTIKE